MCVCTLEPFPPPDDFQLSHINFLQRLQFTWTMNDTYRNCPSLFRIYLTNCSSTCKFSRGIVCPDISTVAQICLFQLQYSICDDIRGNASNLVYVTLKGETYYVIIILSVCIRQAMACNFACGGHAFLPVHMRKRVI